MKTQPKNDPAAQSVMSTLASDPPAITRPPKVETPRLSPQSPAEAGSKQRRLRLATVWMGGCAGCHMSFLDLDEHLLELAEVADLVYSPIADIKEFPQNVDVTLVEGAVCNTDNVALARDIRRNSRLVVSFGDCAVTGNVSSLRNRLGVDDLLTAVYHEGPGRAPHGSDDHVMPTLLPRVLPLHQVIPVDAFLPGCPPDAHRIWTAVSALLKGETVVLDPSLRTFG